MCRDTQYCVVVMCVFLTDSQPRSEGSSESSGLRGLEVRSDNDADIQRSMR